MNYILKNRVSEIPSTTEINKNDLFVISKYDESLSSYQKSNSVNFLDIYSTIIKNFAQLSSFVPDGTFDFTLSTAIPCVEKCNDLSSVANIEFFETNLYSKILELSTMLYGNLSGYPSYVGQIIMSDELSSLEKVQEIYGNNTDWQQIKGRFLFGVGQIGENNMHDYGEIENPVLNINNKKLGGEFQTKLETVPPHSHKFKKASYKKFPEKTISFGVATEDEFDVIRAYTAESPAKTKHHSKGEYLTIEKPDEWLGSKSESKTFSFKAAGNIEENSSTELPHNNMPPYYVTYIWERIS